jgi:hypothetical protein
MSRATLLATVILCGCALSAHAQTTDQGAAATGIGRDTISGGAKAAALTRFSVRAGDAVTIADITYATDDCQPAFIGLESLQIVLAPPELSIAFVPQKTLFRTNAGAICPEPMDGGVVVARAGYVVGRQDSVVVVRLVLNTKLGKAAATYTRRIVLLPRAIRGVDGWPERTTVTDPETQSALKTGDGSDDRR